MTQFALVPDTVPDDLAALRAEVAEIRRLLEGRTDGWLSVPDMAAKHEVTRHTINKWVRTGHLNHEGKRLRAEGSGAARKVRWE